MEYADRFKIIRKELGLSQKELGDKLGLPMINISRIENGDREVKIDVLENLENIGVSSRWLVTGNGEMFLGSGETALAKKEDVVYVRKLDIEAAAGDGITNYTDGEVPVWVGLPASFVYPYRPDSIALLKVNGNSMHPSLSHGDVLLVTEDDRTPVSESIYIIGIGDDLRVKRLEKLPNKGLALVSDNIPYGRKEYTQLELKQQDVRIVARVIKVIKDV